jgi:hypothetical protein
MNDRRSLVEGLNSTPPELPGKRERDFVFKGESPTQPSPVLANKIPRLSALTTRLREDYVIALKRLSLERQIEGQHPNTLQEFLEEAVGDWLKKQGRIRE